MSQPFDSNQLVTIPPLPVSVLRLAEMVTSANADIEKISKIIQFDPVLSASVIRWANSSWSQPESPITRVWDAVLRLGSENILKLAVGYHLMASMRKIAGPLDSTENLLWKHSVAVALAVETLSRISPARVPPVAFTAAIMHDIGKIILGRQQGYQKTAELVRRRRDESGLDELAAEREVAGMDHVALGLNIIQNWGIPEDIVQAVAYHHDPNQSKTALVDSVHAADCLVRGIGLGSDGLTESAAIDPQVLGRLGLDPEQAEQIAATTQSEFSRTAAQWHA